MKKNANWVPYTRYMVINVVFKIMLNFPQFSVVSVDSIFLQYSAHTLHILYVLFIGGDGLTKKQNKIDVKIPLV